MALFWTFCVFVVVLYLQNINCFEPKCSSYDYDKQLLERMIEREYEFRAVRDEIKQANDNVKQGLDEMKEDRILIKQELENIKEDRKLVKEELAESKDTIAKEFAAKASKIDEVFNQQQAVISRMSEDLQKMANKTIQEIKATVKPTVSFRTSATSSFTLSRSPIVFQSVDFNIGNAYDSTTGKFTTPVDGTYLFTVHICVASSKNLNINIVVDDVSVTRSLIHADGHKQCLTATDILNLTTGAKVWIIHNTVWGGTPTFVQDSYARAYFTGLLV